MCHDSLKNFCRSLASGETSRPQFQTRRRNVAAMCEDETWGGHWGVCNSAFFLPCFRKSADRNWLFPLFFKVMSKVFLLHIKHNINHFLSILHVTDQTQAVAVIVGDYLARKILLLLLLRLLFSDLCDMYCYVTQYFDGMSIKSGIF